MPETLSRRSLLRAGVGAGVVLAGAGATAYTVSGRRSVISESDDATTASTVGLPQDGLEVVRGTTSVAVTVADLALFADDGVVECEPCGACTGAGAAAAGTAGTVGAAFSGSGTASSGPGVLVRTLLDAAGADGSEPARLTFRTSGGRRSTIVVGAARIRSGRAVVTGHRHGTGSPGPGDRFALAGLRDGLDDVSLERIEILA
ncbi:hypothetical protein [Curtobacterium sp. RRHDQ10]|uniref:hypothetical protein n=1 Tax=Curtobacterium phyllosphaerae TaxID=3413379 RepID=UPI003BF0BDE0